MKPLNSLLVLDIGRSYVKLVEAEIQDVKPSIKNFSVSALPSELSKVESVNSPSYVDFIRKLLSEKRITATNAVLCISHPQLEVKNLVLPSMNPKELKESIGWQIRDILSLPVEEAVIDYAVLGEVQTAEGKKIELCVAAIPKKVAGEYISLLQALNLTPLAFVLEPQTSWQVIRDIPEFKDKKKTIALINMGAENSIISVFSNNKLRLMRNLPVSGNRFTGGIASRVKTIDGSGLDAERAEFLKCKYGIPAITEVTEENIRPQDIFSSLRPSLEDLVSELSRLIEYYKSENEGENIEAIAIYGGASMLHGLSEYISKNVGIPVISPNLDNFNLEASQKGFFVNAIGAVLVRDRAINLLPPEIKEQERLGYEKGILMKIWIGLVIALTVVYIPFLFNSWLKQRALTRLKSKYEEFSSWKEELDRYGKIVSGLNAKMGLCSELLHDEPFWEDLLKEFASLVPNNIVMKELTLNRGEEGSYRTQKFPLTIAGVVHIRDSSGQEDLTRFLQDLEKSQYFHKIKLEFSKEGKIEEEKVLEFKIGCDIR